MTLSIDILDDDILISNQPEDGDPVSETSWSIYITLSSEWEAWSNSMDDLDKEPPCISIAPYQDKVTISQKCTPDDVKKIVANLQEKKDEIIFLLDKPLTDLIIWCLNNRIGTVIGTINIQDVDKIVQKIYANHEKIDHIRLKIWEQEKYVKSIRKTLHNVKKRLSNEKDKPLVPYIDEYRILSKSYHDLFEQEKFRVKEKFELDELQTNIQLEIKKWNHESTVWIGRKKKTTNKLNSIWYVLYTELAKKVAVLHEDNAKILSNIQWELSKISEQKMNFMMTILSNSEWLSKNRKPTMEYKKSQETNLYNTKVELEKKKLDISKQLEEIVVFQQAKQNYEKINWYKNQKLVIQKTIKKYLNTKKAKAIPRLQWSLQQYQKKIDLCTLEQEKIQQTNNQTLWWEMFMQYVKLTKTRNIIRTETFKENKDWCLEAVLPIDKQLEELEFSYKEKKNKISQNLSSVEKKEKKINLHIHNWDQYILKTQDKLEKKLSSFKVEWPYILHETTRKEMIGFLHHWNFPLYYFIDKDTPEFDEIMQKLEENYYSLKIKQKNALLEDIENHKNEIPYIEQTIYTNMEEMIEFLWKFVLLKDSLQEKLFSLKTTHQKIVSNYIEKIEQNKEQKLEIQKNEVAKTRWPETDEWWNIISDEQTEISEVHELDDDIKKKYDREVQTIFDQYKKLLLEYETWKKTIDTYFIFLDTITIQNDLWEIIQNLKKKTLLDNNCRISWLEWMNWNKKQKCIRPWVNWWHRSEKDRTKKIATWLTKNK